MIDSSRITAKSNTELASLLTGAAKLRALSKVFDMQGYNIAVGKGVYMNFGCILLDSNLIEIGDDTLIGPNVQFYPPGKFCTASQTPHCLAVIRL